MARLLRFAAAVALGGLATAGLTACTRGGSDASPSPTPAVTVTEDTPSPSPTPTLTPEEELLAQIPEDARGESFPEAINFSRFFLELYAPMFGPQHEIEVFDLLCSDASTFCADAVAAAQENASEGAWSEGGEFTWSNDDIGGGPQADGTWNINQAFSQTETVTYLADGTVFSTARAGSGRVGVDLAFGDGHWLVTGVRFEYNGG